jgi:hypothetical protein
MNNNIILIKKVKPDQIGKGRLHYARVSFDWGSFSFIRDKFKAFFPNHKSAEQNGTRTMSARVERGASPIILLYKPSPPSDSPVNLFQGLPYFQFDASCEISLQAVSFILSECLGDQVDSIARISELETRMDIYPCNRKDCTAITRIFAEDLSVPYARQGTIKKVGQTRYTGDRGVSRRFRIYPRPTQAKFKYVRVELAMNRAYIHRQGWRFTDLPRLLDSIDLFSNLNYFLPVSKDRAFDICLRLVKRTYGVDQPHKAQLLRAIAGGMVRSFTHNYFNSWWDLPAAFQRQHFRALFHKRGTRYRPERIFKRYPKEAMILHDLENGYLRRDYRGAQRQHLSHAEGKRYAV